MGIVKSCVFLGIILGWCEAYRILVMIPFVAKSHMNLGDGVVRHLLNDGHEVTYITTAPYKHGPHPKLRKVDVSANAAAIPKDKLNMQFLIEKSNYFNDHVVMSYVTMPYYRMTYENADVQALINDPKEHFDAVILEWGYTELAAGFAAIFDCPLIWLSPIEIDWVILDLIGQPSNPAYVTSVTSYNEIPFNFVQRVQELWTQISVRFRKYFYVDEEERKLYDRLVAPVIKKRRREPPSFYDIQYNASLILANSHVSTGHAVTLPQNYIPIGGYHIEDDIPPLPEDLQKIFDEAKHGVIYFSMGSNMRGNGMPENMRQSLLKMFGTLKQTVIWKYENVMPDVPENVHILRFTPQLSILSHPNCKLFISHGGLLSTIEAIHFGVPMIGMPTFLDQFQNINRVVNRGFGKRVDLTSPDLAGDLKSAIQEVLNNSRYTERVKELSFIHHDRPVSPGAELVHWVKHVVRTRGAPHLRSPAARVPIYQLLYLDLIALIAIILVAFRMTFKYVCGKWYLYVYKKKAE